MNDNDQDQTFDISRRSVLRKGAVTTGALVAGSGVAAADPPNDGAKAGWGLLQSDFFSVDNYQSNGYDSFCERIERGCQMAVGDTGDQRFKLPAGCSQNSKKIDYEYYYVAIDCPNGYRGGRNGITNVLYVPSSHLQPSGQYVIQNVQKCLKGEQFDPATIIDYPGDFCRVHFRKAKNGGNEI